MNNRITKAIDIFLDAINEGTLAKGNCCACAVGNLVAHGMNGKISRLENSFNCNVKNNEWYNLFLTYVSSGQQDIRKENLDSPAVIACIEATEFTWEELAKIEHAFETNTKIYYANYYCYTREKIREDQINGLAAVIKVMETFDNIESDLYVNEFKNRVKKLIL